MSRRAERQTHVQLQDGLIFLFFMQMLCGNPSQLISNSFVRGGKGAPGQPRLLLSFHPTLTLNSSSRQLKES